MTLTGSGLPLTLNEVRLVIKEHQHLDPYYKWIMEELLKMVDGEREKCASMADNYCRYVGLKEELSQEICKGVAASIRAMGDQ